MTTSPRPRATYWSSPNTWIWFPECQKLVARNFGKRELEWIANEVLITAREINEERGKAHLGPAHVGTGAVLFCAQRLGLISPEEYEELVASARGKRNHGRRSARLKEVDGTTYFDPVVREAVFERDGGVCQYCSAPADCIDHLVPVAEGGATRIENLVAACRTCNSIKGSRRFPKRLEAFVSGALRVGRSVAGGWPPIWQQAHAKHPWSPRPVSLTDVFERRGP